MVFIFYLDLVFKIRYQGRSFRDKFLGKTWGSGRGRWMVCEGLEVRGSLKQGEEEQGLDQGVVALCACVHMSARVPASVCAGFSMCMWLRVLMLMCTYVCTFQYMAVCCMHESAHVWLCVHECVHAPVCVCVFTCVHAPVCGLCARMSAHVCVRVCVAVCVRVAFCCHQQGGVLSSSGLQGQAAVSLRAEQSTWGLGMQKPKNQTNKRSGTGYK